MHLEILQKQPSQPTTKKPILFIHGAFAGAWCWEEYFLPYFAEQGHPAYAVSLRGHGESEGIENLAFTSLDHYVADVRAAVELIGEDPILVGHSMGGMIIQKYLETHPSPAAVLMNSVPPTGLWTTIFYMAWSDPMLFGQLFLLQNLSPRFATPNAVKHALLSEDVPDDKLHKFFHHVQGESQRVMLDMMGLNLPHLMFKGPLPLLVLGAEKDAFLPPSVVEWTAHLYDADSYVFPRTAHAMMLENNWKDVADYIIAWLEKTIPASKPVVETKKPIAEVVVPVKPVVEVLVKPETAVEAKVITPEVAKPSAPTAAETSKPQAVLEVKNVPEAIKPVISEAVSKPVETEAVKPHTEAVSHVDNGTATTPVNAEAAVIPSASTTVKRTERKIVKPKTSNAKKPSSTDK